MSEQQYTTRVVAPSQRFEYWKEVVCHHCITATSQPLTRGNFDGTLQVQTFGVLDLCSLSAPLHDWERAPRHLRNDPDDDLWLGFSHRGHGRLEQGGRQAVLTTDALFLYDASQTFRFHLGGDNHLVRIPRHLLSSRAPRVAQQTAIVLDERRPGIVPLRELLRQAAQAPPELLQPEIAGRLSRTLLDLLTLSLDLQHTRTSHAEHDLHARMMNYIQRHLANPELSLERLAQAHHVSTRTVTRAFARHQQTPMAVIWSERLHASREAMERGSVRSVSQAAMAFGFTDFSHFSHAFRKAFGVSPSSVLGRGSMAVAAPEAAPPAC